MYYVLKFRDYPCPQLEGFTDNEFVFQRYLKQFNATFKSINYDTFVEDMDLPELLETYDFKRLQKFRSYQSEDKTVSVYCNPVLFSEWFGIIDRKTPWSYLNTSKVPAVIKRLLDASLNMTQLVFYLNTETRDQLLSYLRRLLVHAITSQENYERGMVTSSGFDPVKLLVYVNNIPKETVI